LMRVSTHLILALSLAAAVIIQQGCTECDPEHSTCQGNSLISCESSSAFSLVKKYDCGAFEHSVCVERNGSAQCVAAEMKACVEGDKITCNADGTAALACASSVGLASWLPCAKGDACVEVAAGCVNPEMKACDGLTGRLCSNDGAAVLTCWRVGYGTTLSRCANNEVCAEGHEWVGDEDWHIAGCFRKGEICPANPAVFVGCIMSPLAECPGGYECSNGRYVVGCDGVHAYKVVRFDCATSTDKSCDVCK
jgi:hypothetical protein